MEVTNVLDNSHTRGNLHWTRNQRLSAGRVLIQLAVEDSPSAPKPTGLFFNPAHASIAASYAATSRGCHERVRHGLGEVVTGWKYADGRGGNPVHQYCYYSAPNADHSSRRVDIASNRIPSPNINGKLVPDLEGALAKCQWGPG
jgi:hypothetical protein